MPELTEIPVAYPQAELPPLEPTTAKASRGVQIVTFLAIIIPLFSVIAAPFFVWGWGFGWTDMGLLLGMYTLTAWGITVGFHRLFVHRSFETYMWIKFIFGVLGSMAVQGSLFHWVGMHRLHHQFSDKVEDPHSPHHHGEGILGMLKGFWHAHIGWFFDKEPSDIDRYVKDLRSSLALRVVNKLFLVWVVLGLVLPAVLGGVITQSWSGVWTGLIWGGLVRVFLVSSCNMECELCMSFVGHEALSK